MLGIRDTFDIHLVAIDAWLSADVRNATTRAPLVGAATYGLERLTDRKD